MTIIYLTLLFAIAVLFVAGITQTTIDYIKKKYAQH